MSHPPGAVIITGATSGIGSAIAAHLAARGSNLVLAARDADELERMSRDLSTRHRVRVATERFDAMDRESVLGLFARCAAAAGGAPLGVIVCHGTMGDEPRVHHDGREAMSVIEVNLTSAVAFLIEAAEHFEPRREGFLCAISSVAGDRGRQSNFAYGAAKGGLSIFMQGLRHRLAPAGVAVVTIKPGFVDTPMTFGRTGLFLVASRERAARDICRAIDRRRGVAYVPWFWRWIMLVIRSVPTFIMHRTKL